MFIKKVCSISNVKKFQSNQSEIPNQSMGLQSTLYYVNQQTTNRGGGGYSINFLYGEAPPRGPTPYPFIYHSSQKGAPFVYRLLLTNGTPFTYLVQNFASLLTVVNALLFKQESITKIERFLDFRKSHKIYLLALWALSQTQLTDTSTSKIPTLSYTRSLKKVPLSVGASRVGHYREYPRRPLRIHC